MQLMSLDIAYILALKGSGYNGYGTVPGGRWTIDMEGGHDEDSVSRIRSGNEYGISQI